MTEVFCPASHNFYMSGSDLKPNSTQLESIHTFHCIILNKYSEDIKMGFETSPKAWTVT